MKLSVVIPTYKPQDLTPLLAALVDQQDQEFELVVVENGSDTAVLLNELENYELSFPYVYIHEATPGLNHARNLGVKASSGTHIVLIDDDCLPDNKWTGAVKEAHRSYPSAGVIGGRVLLKHIEPPPTWLNTEFRRSLAELDYGAELAPLGRWQHLVGANLSFSRAVFDQVGGFQESFGLSGDESIIRANDEAEFIHKASVRGLPGAIYAGTAVVEHAIPGYRTEFESLLKRRFGQGVSDVEYDLLQSGINRAYRSFYTQVYRSQWHLDELNEDRMQLSEDASLECLWRGMLARVAYLMGSRERLISATPAFNVINAVGVVEVKAYQRGRELTYIEHHSIEKPLAVDLLQRALYQARSTFSPFTRVAMTAGMASHDLEIELRPPEADMAMQ